MTGYEDLRRGPRRQSAGARPQSRWRRACTRLLVVVAALLAVALAVVAVAWPATPQVGDASTRVSRLLARHHDPLLAVLPRPDRVGQAVVATEDSRFFRHWGID